MWPPLHAGAKGLDWQSQGMSLISFCLLVYICSMTIASCIVEGVMGEDATNMHMPWLRVLWVGYFKLICSQG